MKITSAGYAFDTNTNEFEYTEITCWNCKGTRIVTIHDICPRYGRKQHGKACKFCGSKSADGHKSVGQHKETCHTCKGQGHYTATAFDSLDATPLLDWMTFRIIKGTGTFNDHYLGIGNVCGMQGYDYGKYSTVEKMMPSIKEHLKYIQMGNFVSKTGQVSDTLYLKVSPDGCEFYGFVLGAQFSH